jgi:hypothetical protein
LAAQVATLLLDDELLAMEQRTDKIERCVEVSFIESFSAIDTKVRSRQLMMLWAYSVEKCPPIEKK